MVLVIYRFYLCDNGSRSSSLIVPVYCIFSNISLWELQKTDLSDGQAIVLY